MAKNNPSPRHATHPTPDPTAGPLTGRPFPDVAEALRSRAGMILRDWEREVRRNVPQAKHISFDEVLDGLPDILNNMADSLASGEPDKIRRLMERSPEQGIHRFQLHYDVRELATEDRLLRRLIVEHVGAALGRRASAEEDAALNWVIDLMGQQAMVAFVGHQNARLREAAEAELKYLSFLSHDLRGNLGNVTLWLQVLRRKLAASGHLAEEVAALDEAQQAIRNTMGGMGRLLQAERLRHQGVVARAGPLDLHELAASVARQFAVEAGRKGLAMDVQVPAGATVHSDAEMVTLILQNLIGNAVKYSSGGTVRVHAEQEEDGRKGGWSLSVSDEGPGIAPEQVGRLFEAFRRGDTHGQAGVGLGLAIASRAAKLLGIELTVESEGGKGSTFRLAFPAAPAGAPHPPSSGSRAP